MVATQTHSSGRVEERLRVRGVVSVASARRVGPAMQLACTACQRRGQSCQERNTACGGEALPKLTDELHIEGGRLGCRGEDVTVDGESSSDLPAWEIDSLLDLKVDGRAGALTWLGRRAARAQDVALSSVR